VVEGEGAGDLSIGLCGGWWHRGRNTSKHSETLMTLLACRGVVVKKEEASMREKSRVKGFC